MKISEKHPIEAEIAKKLVAEFLVQDARDDEQVIILTKQRADVLEQKIAEALVEAYCHGVEAP